MIHTVLISRNLTTDVGVPSGIPVARVLQLCLGDCCSLWYAKSGMKEIFYWKTVDLTSEQANEIETYLEPQLQDGEGNLIPRLKNVDLDCFSNEELTVASERGSLVHGVGGQLTFSNFVLTDI